MQRDITSLAGSGVDAVDWAKPSASTRLPTAQRAAGKPHGSAARTGSMA